MRRSIAIALVGTLAVAGTACSSSSDSKADKLDEARAAASKAKARSTARGSTSSTTVAFVNDTDHTPGTLKKFDGAKSDVHDSTCEAEGGSWVAAGKVTNPTKSPVRYRIYVSFLRGDATVALSETNLASVAPGATEDWKTSVKTTVSDVRCILRVERASA